MSPAVQEGGTTEYDAAASETTSCPAGTQRKWCRDDASAQPSGPGVLLTSHDRPGLTSLLPQPLEPEVMDTANDETREVVSKSHCRKSEAAAEPDCGRFCLRRFRREHCPSGSETTSRHVFICSCWAGATGKSAAEVRLGSRRSAGHFRMGVSQSGLLWFTILAVPHAHRRPVLMASLCCVADGANRFTALGTAGSSVAADPAGPRDGV